MLKHAVQYADKLYSKLVEDDEDKGKGDANTDIEADIKDEIEELHKSTGTSLFQPIKIDVKCGMCHGIWHALI